MARRTVFGLGDKVFVKDRDDDGDECEDEEDWRFGIVEAIDEDGQPKVLVEGFESAYVWDECKKAETTNSDIDASVENISSVSSTQRTNEVTTPVKINGTSASDDEPQTLEEYFELMRLQRLAKKTKHEVQGKSPLKIRNTSKECCSTWIYAANPDQWQSFRQSDQQRIKQCVDCGENIVAVNGGRWMLKLNERILSPIYWKGDSLPVRLCQWCWKDGKCWKPFGDDEEEENKIEETYQHFKCLIELDGLPKKYFETSDLILDRTVCFSLVGEDEIVATVKNKDQWKLSWFKTVLKRGWGGENEQANPCDDQEAKHLVLIVHGVGESLFAKGDIPWPTFVEVTDSMRIMTQTANQKTNSKVEPTKNKKGEHIQGKDGQNEHIETSMKDNEKIEILPIEWYQACEVRKKQLSRATLPSVPRMRDIVNEILLDAVLFLMPHWRQIILDTVVSQIHKVIDLFSLNNPSWDTNCVTLVGHSLGSVVLFELLTSLDLPASQTLSFTPHNFIALGSPIGYFFDSSEQSSSWLMERLDHMRIHPKGLFRNGFHPNDPLAYRLEPLLCPHYSLKTEEEAKEEDIVLSEGNNSDVSNESNETVEIVFRDPVRVRTLLTNENSDPPPRLSKQTDVKNKENMIVTESEETFACQHCLKCPDCLELRSQFEPLTEVSSLRHRIDFVFESSTRNRVSQYFSSLKAHTSYFERSEVAEFLVLAVNHMTRPQPKNADVGLRGALVSEGLPNKCHKFRDEEDNDGVNATEGNDTMELLEPLALTEAAVEVTEDKFDQDIVAEGRKYEVKKGSVLEQVASTAHDHEDMYWAPAALQVLAINSKLETETEANATVGT